MARKTIALSVDGGPPPIGHNSELSEAERVSELSKIQDHWRDKEAAKDAYQRENAVYRRALKDAKARGLNLDAILDMVRIWQSDPKDVAQRFKDTIRYCLDMGMPIGTQAEIFGDQDLGNPAELGREKVAGRKQTGTRSMEKANPYPKGSWQAREFERGWIEGARAG